MKKLLWSLLAITILSACGHTSSSSSVAETREQMIERVLNLPPEPDETKNNSTILGVDVNANGIRDDVERKIAFLLYPDTDAITLHNQRALIWADEMKLLNVNNIDEMLLKDRHSSYLLICLREHFSDRELHNQYISEIDKALINTQERHEAINRYHSKFSGMMFELPSKSESLKFCEGVLDAETRVEMIERVLNLPPEPDEDENNSTILGIDVNANNIRDDVERKIAFDLYENSSEMKRHMRYAQIWTEVFLADGDKDKLISLDFEINNNIGCQLVGVTSDEGFYERYESRYQTEKLLNNNEMRKDAYWEAKHFEKEAFLIMPSFEETESYCSQFDN